MQHRKKKYYDVLWGTAKAMHTICDWPDYHLHGCCYFSKKNIHIMIFIVDVLLEWNMMNWDYRAALICRLWLLLTRASILLTHIYWSLVYKWPQNEYMRTFNGFLFIIWDLTVKEWFCYIFHLICLLLYVKFIMVCFQYIYTKHFIFIGL